MTAQGCPMGGERCPEAICDCFIDLYPDDPLGLHPEAFVVGPPTTTRVVEEPSPRHVHAVDYETSDGPDHTGTIRLVEHCACGAIAITTDWVS